MQTRLQVPSHTSGLTCRWETPVRFTPGFTPQRRPKAGPQATHIKGAPRLPEQTLCLSLLLKWPPPQALSEKPAPTLTATSHTSPSQWSLAHSTRVKQNTDVSPPLGRKQGGERLPFPCQTL